MNDFSEIESELKKLQPVPVGANLIARIEKAFLEESSLPTPSAPTHNRSTRTNWISLGLGLGLAAAAGLLMLARVNDNQPAKNQPSVAAVKPEPNERPSEQQLRSSGFQTAGGTINTERMVPASLT